MYKIVMSGIQLVHSTRGLLLAKKGETDILAKNMQMPWQRTALVFVLRF
jgi:hypothetical protein